MYIHCLNANMLSFNKFLCACKSKGLADLWDRLKAMEPFVYIYIYIYAYMQVYERKLPQVLSLVRLLPLRCLTPLTSRIYILRWEMDSMLHVLAWSC